MSGGDILSTRNLTEGPLFKVLQKPLDTTDRPLDMDRTEGHCMVLCEGYLDPAVYKQRTPGDTGWACPGHAYRHGCGRSQTDTSSGGRFLGLTPEYLETAIYRAGRAFTVAGEVRGPRGLPGGETVYRYPLLAPREMYLWPEGDGGSSLFHFGFGFGFSKSL